MSWEILWLQKLSEGRYSTRSEVMAVTETKYYQIKVPVP